MDRMLPHLDLVCTLVISLACAQAALGADATPPSARSLADYANDDGTVPDGKDDANDDTAAMQKALADGPGVVYVGPGHYRWGDVAIPAGVTVQGAGRATVVRSNGAKQIFAQRAVSDWAVRDLVLDGEAQGDWHERADEGQSGIFTEGCWGYEIVGVTARNFSGAGLQLSHSNLGDGGFCAGGNLARITAYQNHVGVRFDTRAEYINATELSCFHNVVGCVIHAGNAKITASNFGTNRDGILVQDKENGSHGSITNCLVNHNERYALQCTGVRNGMAVDGCCFFYGAIQVDTSVGVSITGGQISCTVSVTGDGANRIADNYIILLPEWTFTFAPGTIVEGNFTEKGMWEQNIR